MVFILLNSKFKQNNYYHYRDTQNNYTLLYQWQPYYRVALFQSSYHVFVLLNWLHFFQNIIFALQERQELVNQSINASRIYHDEISIQVKQTEVQLIQNALATLESCCCLSRSNVCVSGGGGGTQLSMMTMHLNLMYCRKVPCRCMHWLCALR